MLKILRAALLLASCSSTHRPPRPTFRHPTSGLKSEPGPRVGGGGVAKTQTIKTKKKNKKRKTKVRTTNQTNQRPDLPGATPRLDGGAVTQREGAWPEPSLPPPPLLWFERRFSLPPERWAAETLLLRRCDRITNWRLLLPAAGTVALLPAGAPFEVPFRHVFGKRRRAETR